MINKKNKFLRITLIIFVSILSIIFAFMPFLIVKQNYVGVFADSTSDYQSFTGSDVPFSCQVSNIDVANNTVGYHRRIFMSSKMDCDSSGSRSFIFRFYNMFPFLYSSTDSGGISRIAYSFNFPSGNTLSQMLGYSSISGFSDNTYVDSFTRIISSSSSDQFIFYNCSFNTDVSISSQFYVNIPFIITPSNSSTGYIVNCYISGDTDFSVPIGCEFLWNSTFIYNFGNGNGPTFNCFELKYFDSNNKFISIKFVNDSGSSYSFPNRIYYFSQVEDDNSYYRQGYLDGYNTGNADGLSSGYTDGYNTGYSNGQNAGYNDGLSAGADVSFLNLIGATVDAPVKAFTGLLDFNINMGGSSFNLKGFFVALLSIALIIALIRIILAKS